MVLLHTMIFSDTKHVDFSDMMRWWYEYMKRKQVVEWCPSSEIQHIYLVCSSVSGIFGIPQSGPAKHIDVDRLIDWHRYHSFSVFGKNKEPFWAIYSKSWTPDLRPYIWDDSLTFCHHLGWPQRFGRYKWPEPWFPWGYPHGLQSFGQPSTGLVIFSCGFFDPWEVVTIGNQGMQGFTQNRYVNWNHTWISPELF